MRYGYNIDTITSVDKQEVLINKGDVIEIHEGVINQENFKISLFRNDIEKMFALRQKYKDEHNDLLQWLIN